ncbi:MAG: hypothetical protein P8Y73_00595 [Desulfuromonadales bacterium]
MTNPGEETGAPWPFAQMQKTTGGTPEITRARPFACWWVMQENSLGTGCYRDFKTILKQGFADLRGAQESFSQICKKSVWDRGTRKTTQEVAAKKGCRGGSPETTVSKG